MRPVPALHDTLHINDLFWTFQGEGLHTGRRALFVRMPFCNQTCDWCDTSFDRFSVWSVMDFLKFATKEKCRFAVITGGEPMMNKHTPPIVDLLKTEGFEVATETNGNFSIVDGVDFVTVSPKRYSKVFEPFYIHPDAWNNGNEFKYVVEDGFNFEILKRHDTKDGRRYSLSPEWNKKEASLGRIYEFIKENPDWKINLQTHKYLGLP